MARSFHLADVPTRVITFGGFPGIESAGEGPDPGGTRTLTRLPAKPYPYSDDDTDAVRLRLLIHPRTARGMAQQVTMAGMVIPP